jgi:hypothetical protein
MPIARTFATVTPSSSAWSQAIGNGADDSDWDNIDLEDGWTRTGTNVTVATLAVDGTKKHTFTMTAIANSDADLCPLTTGNFTGDTWTKDLRMPDGYQMTGDDNFMLVMEGHIYDPGVDKEDIAVTWGLCGDASTTVINDRAFFGTLMWETSAGTVQFAGGTQCRGAQTNNQNTAMTRVYNVFSFSKNSVGAGTFHTYQADGSTQGKGSRNANYTWTGNPNLKLCVQVGCRQNSDSYDAGKKILVNMRYKLIRITDLP